MIMLYVLVCLFGTDRDRALLVFYAELRNLIVNDCLSDVFGKRKDRQAPRGETR